MDRENEAAVILTHGVISLGPALEEVLESFPEATRAQALYTDVLAQRGEGALEHALAPTREHPSSPRASTAGDAGQRS